MLNFDISAAPRWVFAFAALIIAISSGYGMFYAECTTQLFNLKFGQDRPCVRGDSNLIEKFQSLELEHSSLKNKVDELATRDRNAFQLTITNHGKGDTAGCPKGTFVSSIKAPGGVGGKFATDGINKIEYGCSPVVIE